MFLSDLFKDVKELLEKSRADDIKAALGPHADWAKKTLAYDDNGKTKPHAPHLDWLANAVSKNPAALTEAKKTELASYADKYHLPEVKSADLQGMDLDAGLNKLGGQVFKGLGNQAAKKGHVAPKGEILQPTKTGKAWHNLGVAGCAEEGRAGIHCGNTPALNSDSGRTHERVLSLREPTNRADTLKQHLTFVNSNGYINEGKGRRNTKPKSDYHSDIIDLLENPKIKGYVGGGYLPGSNFDPDDVKDPEQKQRLKDLEAKKPGFFTPDVSDLHETIRSDPFLPLSVTNKAERGKAEVKAKELTPQEHADMMEEFRSSEPDSLTHQRLAQNPNISPELASKLLEANKEPGSSTHDYLASNPNISPELASKLLEVNEPDSDTHQLLAYNPNISPELASKLFEVNKEPDSDTHRMLASNPNISPELASKLLEVNKPDSNTHRRLAQNPNISPELASKLLEVNKPDSLTHQRLAQNPNISPELASKLLEANKEPDSLTHQRLASNPNISPELASKLFEVNKEPDSDTHRRLASNPNISPELASKLLEVNKEPDSDTHRMLASNPNISPELASKLLEVNKEPGSDVHRRLASNPNISPELASKLFEVNEPGSDVHRILQERPFSQEDHDVKEAALLKTIKDAQYLDKEGNPQEAYEGAAVAQQNAADSLNKLRRNNIIRKIKEPGADVDFIKRYEYSHNKEASDAAKKALKDRGMKKSDALQKARPAGRGFVPEKSDIGEPHPTDKNQIGHVSKLNQIVWSHTPTLVASQENSIKKYGHTAKLSPSGSAKAAALYYHLHDDPDKGVMASGTTTGHQGDFKELRMRHLHNAIMKRPGSSISEDKNGIIIEADRHSGNEKNTGAATTWHWDGKTLKSFHENPISGNTSEGSYTYDKLGKSSGTDGRGIFEARGLGRLQLLFAGRLRANRGGGELLSAPAEGGREELSKSEGPKPLTSHRLIHDTLDKIHAKHGTRVGNATAADLLSLVERGDLERLHKHMAAAGYGSNPKHTISHLRAILISPKQRQAFHQGMSVRDAKKSHSRLMKSWRAMLGACKEIHGSLSKSEDALAKGAAKKNFPDYSPVHSKTSTDQANKWLVEAKPHAREGLPRMEGGERHRGLNKIANSTESRKNPQTGSREFKLHRGMSEKELKNHQAGKINTKTSWTPDFATANRFAETGGPDDHVVTAWVPEEHIHHMPYMLGHDTEARGLREEQEVVINPHKTSIIRAAKPDDLGVYESANIDGKYWSKQPIDYVKRVGGKEEAKKEIQRRLTPDGRRGRQEKPEVKKK